MGIPLTALSVQPPPQQESPVNQYAKLVQLKALLGQQQYEQQARPLQLQQAQQEIQKNQQAMQETQAVNQAYRDSLSMSSDGSPEIDASKLQKSLSESGHGSAIPGILENTAKYQKSMSDATNAQQDVQSSMQDAMGSVGNAIAQANYDPNLADVFLQHQMAIPGVPPAYKQQLQQIDQQIKANPGAVKQIADQLVAVSQKQQAFNNALKVANVRANTPDAQVLKSALETGQIKDPSEFPAFKERQTAAASVAAQTSPQALQAKAQLASTESNARIAAENSPTAVQGAANKALAVQKAVASAGGANAPLANVPPHLVAPAAAAANKAGTDFSQALQGADDMQSMIDLARKGNKVAYAYSPVTGVLQINVAGQTKRINTTEIEQYGGAGSALDRIKAFLGKQESGASIPAGVLNDMESVSKMFGDNASAKYQRDLDVLNSTYGSDFKVPSALKRGAASTQSESAPQLKIGQQVTIKGQKKIITAVHPDGTFDAK